jgi:hypothetical protein
MIWSRWDVKYHINIGALPHGAVAPPPSSQRVILSNQLPQVIPRIRHGPPFDNQVGRRYTLKIYYYISTLHFPVNPHTYGRCWQVGRSVMVFLFVGMAGNFHHLSPPNTDLCTDGFRFTGFMAEFATEPMRQRLVIASMSKNPLVKSITPGPLFSVLV